MNKTINEELVELKEIIIAMHEINKIDSDFTDENKKKSLKLGAKFNKLLKNLLSSENGIQILTNSMSDNNPIVVFIISRYLYPLYPKKTMKIMENYQKTIVDGLEKLRVTDVINGLKSNQPVFMNQFKKLYDTENLESLNRE